MKTEVCLLERPGENGLRGVWSWPQISVGRELSRTPTDCQDHMGVKGGL